MDDDATLINHPDHNISDFSKTTNENTSQLGAHAVFESSVSHVSHDDFAKKAYIGKPIARQRDRERERKEKVLWSVLHSRCQRKVNGTVLVRVWRVTENPVLKSLRKFYSDGWDLLEHLQRRAQQAIIGENSIQRNFYLNEYKMELQKLERRNSEYALFESQRELESQRRQLLKTNEWADQAQRERIHLCSELEMKNRLHQECCARSCQEIEELRRRCYQGSKYWKTTKIGRISYAAWSGITNSESILLRFWLTKQLWRTYVPHQALITSSSRKPGREVGMLRNTREDMSTPGNVFDRQHAQRDSGELHMIQEIWRYHWRLWEQKELRIVKRRTIAINTFTLLFRNSKERKV